MILPSFVLHHNLVNRHGVAGRPERGLDKFSMVTHVAGEDRARSAQCAPLVPDPAPVETHRRWADDTAIESFRPGLNYLLFQTADPIIAGGALAAKAHVVPEFAKGREKGMIACSAPWVKLVSTIYASLQVHTSILGKEGPSSFR